MLALLKKKSTICSIIVIAILISIGIFIAVINKTANKVSSKSSKIKLVSYAKNKTNTSSNENNTANTQNTTTASDTVSSAISNNKPTSNSQPISQNYTSIKQVQPASVQKTISNRVQTTAAQPQQQSNQSTIPQPSQQKYVSNNLSLSITFPGSWQGKYTISEYKDGLNVMFKPVSHPADGGGLLFTIVKKTANVDENMLETVGKRYVTNGKGEVFVIGGPTDVGFPPDNPEYSIYKQLSSEQPYVVNSIRSIN